MHLYVLGSHLLLTYNIANVYSSTKAGFVFKLNLRFFTTMRLWQYLNLNIYV